MIAGLKPYPRMKESGVPWLGAVPEHWEVLPLKHWVRMNRAVLPESTPPEYEFHYLDIGSVGTGVLTAKPRRIRFGDAPSRARRIARKGDTIVSTVRTYLQAIYFLDQGSDELVCSTGFAVLSPAPRTVPKFVSYLSQSSGFTHRITADSVGIAYPAIAETRFGALHVVVPPEHEQAAMVRFLDYAERRIRRYVRAQQQLIKLLEEQKQAIIHRAVTRGLAPNVRLKPSGVPWLGDVPEHWGVIPLKRIAYFKSGAGFPIAEQGTQGGEIPFLKVSDMNRTGNETWIETADSTVSKETAQRLRAYVLPANSVIFPKVGGALLTNKRRLLRVPSCVDNNVMGCVVHGADLQYAFILLQRIDLGRLAKPGPVPAIGESEVGEIKVAVPPLEEQSAIVAFLERECSQLVDAIDHGGREITLLREYRTRLIADVVTGKLDVREAAAQLPEETQDFEPLEEVEADTEEAAEAEDTAEAQEMEA
ncbi:MAG TPA: restriction endonuclease subunit S [Verrucomicrobiota bacterium]|nr:MAG: EcoKI restriction-modification system protein HsdS [Verrucomicrobia bacterium ADurb.Bin118]HPY29800.1 restriction endonuclease subunit S [Verrucomicrobiota bacterium]HQB16297.1 restriction endonuclease subunit S [Verrucomicrobiota bacterium]